MTGASNPYDKSNAPWWCRVFGHEIVVNRKLNYKRLIVPYCDRCGYPIKLMMKRNEIEAESLEEKEEQVSASKPFFHHFP